MSTVQAQVKKKIFEKFQVAGFVSLIKSSDVLVRVMKKLGLLEDIGFEYEEGDGDSEGIELVLGGVEDVFNSHDNLEYYYFAFSGEYRNPTIIGFKIENFPLKSETEYCQEVQEGGLIEFEFYKYYKSKDPPMMKF